MTEGNLNRGEERGRKRVGGRGRERGLELTFRGRKRVYRKKRQIE